MPATGSRLGYWRGAPPALRNLPGEFFAYCLWLPSRAPIVRGMTTTPETGDTNTRATFTDTDLIARHTLDDGGVLDLRIIWGNPDGFGGDCELIGWGTYLDGAEDGDDYILFTYEGDEDAARERFTDTAADYNLQISEFLADPTLR
jgi:hypothetical protein